MPPRKPKTKSKAKSKARTYTKKRSTAVKQSDQTQNVCAIFIDTDADLSAGGAVYGNGRLVVPTGVGGATTVGEGAEFVIQATIALDNRNNLLQSITHSSYCQLFNEWNQSGIYLDLLFSPKLRANADQVFLLVESGNDAAIATEDMMCSDIQHKMFQLMDTTQKITFSHKFTTPNDKLMKPSVPASAPTKQELTYLKILCRGENISGGAINCDDLKIKIRAKSYNSYRDMKVLTHALN